MTYWLVLVLQGDDPELLPAPPVPEVPPPGKPADMGQMRELMDGLGPLVEGGGHPDDAPLNAAMLERHDINVQLAQLRAQVLEVHSSPSP